MVKPVLLRTWLVHQVSRKQGWNSSSLVIVIGFVRSARLSVPKSAINRHQINVVNLKLNSSKYSTIQHICFKSKQFV